ncbi:hypothetical protein W04_3419 [Pseudoalteromonas sp. SW0106-04]|nr:hypothetical protein W04_3419 [Pseudoalteromonas sp. SW0106-04]
MTSTEKDISPAPHALLAEWADMADVRAYYWLLRYTFI